MFISAADSNWSVNELKWLSWECIMFRWPRPTLRWNINTNYSIVDATFLIREAVKVKALLVSHWSPSFIQSIQQASGCGHEGSMASIGFQQSITECLLQSYGQKHVKTACLSACSPLFSPHLRSNSFLEANLQELGAHAVPTILDHQLPWNDVQSISVKEDDRWWNEVPGYRPLQSCRG